MAHELMQTRLMRAAMRASRRADNYRNFNVGAALLCVDKQGRLRTVTGACWMPVPHGEHFRAPKRCAEMRALKKVTERGYRQVLAIAVAAPLQADDTSEHAAITTHPCDACRMMLSASPLIEDDTLIITVQHPAGARIPRTPRKVLRRPHEVHTLEALLSRHTPGAHCIH